VSKPPRSETNARTLAAYEASAELYMRAQYATPPQGLLRFMDTIADRLAAGASMLEIGSATGQDAELLEQRGLLVRRSDAAEAFVRSLRAQGFEADLLNVISDELGGPWDGIYANAVFLHLTAEELGAVLARTAAVVVPGGLLAFTLKEGDGAAWSSHKLERPRHFTYWREEPLRELIAGSPWELEVLEHETGRKDDWLQCLCRAGGRHAPEGEPALPLRNAGR